MTFIDFNNINLKYEDKIILDDFSLAVHKGEKILITGKSGKGKSTILRLLLGFSNYDSGQILVKNMDLSNADFTSIRQVFAYVNQDVTLRSGKVKDVLTEVSHFSGNNFNNEFSTELARSFEFDLNLLEKHTTELSGGERQRLGIILAILLDRDVFLLDEVTSGLDPDLKNKVVQYFSHTEKTVIAISHDSCWSNSKHFKEVIW